jgi:hypothetical protein
MSLPVSSGIELNGEPEWNSTDELESERQLIIKWRTRMELNR